MQGSRAPHPAVNVVQAHPSEHFIESPSSECAISMENFATFGLSAGAVEPMRMIMSVAKRKLLGFMAQLPCLEKASDTNIH